MSKKIMITSLLLLFLVFNFTAGNILQTETTVNNFSPTIEKVQISSVYLLTKNYFVMTASFVDGINASSASATLKSPSQKDKIDIRLFNQGSTWNSSFVIPSTFENGLWYVEEITLIDEELRTKKYDKDEINATFLFGKENNLETLNTSVLLEQKKQECIQNNGYWDETANSCLCSLNYQLQESGICLYVPPCSFEYSPWSQCQTDGTQTRTVISSSNCSSTDSPVLSQECSYVERSCSFEYSPWSQCQTDGTQTRTVISSCPDEEPILSQRCTYVPSPEELFRKKTRELNSIQKIIEYLNIDFNIISNDNESSFSLQEIFNKKEGNENDLLSFALHALTENNFSSSIIAYEYQINNQNKIKYLISTNDNNLPQYIYFDGSNLIVDNYDWSIINLLKKEEERAGVNILRYSNVLSLPIKDNNQQWTNFVKNEENEDAETNVCIFEYSPWSQCQTDGTRTRRVLSFSPNNCEGGKAELKEECVYVKPIIPCLFEYSPWSQCQPNGTQVRKLNSKMPANCNDGEAVLARSCKYIEPVVKEEIIAPTPITISEMVTQETETKEKDISEECLISGINNEEDCNLYSYQLKIVPECLSLNINTQEECRNYFLSNYEKPLKCSSLSEESCTKLINDVILGNLKNIITEDKKAQLTEVSGKKATISRIDNSTKINVSVNEAESKEIVIENLPISIKENESVQIKLISIETKENQKGLSPVAISMSSEDNDLPDDVITRIGKDFNVENLSGVDKAIVEGKTLEQPKYNLPLVLEEKITVEKIETVKKEEKDFLVVKGRANPGEIITLFIYSSMPIVVTVEADQDGNWIYSLDKSMVDGTHEVYAVLHNDEGKIIEASNPKTFFIAEAQAISIDDMFLSDNIINDSENIMNLYLLGGISIIVILISLFLIIKGRAEEL
jgi:hypothetical protein